MKRSFSSPGIYLVTSQRFSAGRKTPEIVKAALDAGVKYIQVREKEMSDIDFFKTVETVIDLCKRYDVPVIVNDRVDIAIATGADGVHVGQSDLPVKVIKNIQPDLIVGCSTHSIEQALKAEADGADYVNLGPIFLTTTKESDISVLGPDVIKEAKLKLRIPFTVMGGIKPCHIYDLVKKGARIIAVISAITASEDPYKSALTLVRTLYDALGC